jgi:CheY-like chemotaxis protein/anti-sigma regulatory factor (Ser/Thr protein kinase)
VDRRTAELVEAKDQAESANRAKSAFLANMSHELRTPLNAVLGFSHLLRERGASEEQRRDLDIINRSGEHLLTLINDVLDLAKIEAGRTVLEIGACDLKTLLQDTAEMMRVRAQEKHLSLILEEEPGLPRFVRADTARLRQVLINLLANAVKFTSDGYVTLRASARNAGGPVLLRFEIEDTGVGIAQEDQARVFDAFEQIGRAGGRSGTGLGLTIARQLVQLMDGTIELESTPGKGSCFRVEMPVDVAEEAETRVAAPRERVLGLEDGQPECRVLVVEDHPENRIMLERLLRDAGFQVRTAENGEQGVRMFGEWRPRFIWMDLRMPVMDGLEAVRRIRALEGGRDVRIATMTASGFDSQRSEVLAAGFDDYVRKPYRPEDIFDCMERRLGVRYRRAEAAAPALGDPAAELKPEALAALPPDLRDELREALTALHVKRVALAVERVAERDAALGAVLARCAKQFAYSVMLRALQDGKQQSSAQTSG